MNAIQVEKLDVRSGRCWDGQVDGLEGVRTIERFFVKTTKELIENVVYYVTDQGNILRVKLPGFNDLWLTNQEALDFVSVHALTIDPTLDMQTEAENDSVYEQLEVNS